ncbi:NADPH-dependent F420 reductase [Streptomyces sp. NPDC056660]|uniref:NADPH-dependent F420 reductase n=1 Tax=Streptomyces sp. NPDC056660 TaxID=3345897 RepID=UPI00369950E9
MTSVGLLGAGNIATAIATRAVAAGVERVIISNSRGPASLAEQAARLGPQVVAGAGADAGQADIVVVAVPWSKVEAAVSRIEDWHGKILVDATNPIEAPTFEPADLGGKTSSEIVAALTPGARVVKAFNTHSPQALASDPAVGGGRRVLFYSGDDPDAKREVGAFITRLGFEAIDLGGLVDGGRLHQFPGGPLPARDLVQL